MNQGYTLRNRIVGHRRVKACELKEHPLNPRTHGEEQRTGLRALLAEVGLARSVLAYVSDDDRQQFDEAYKAFVESNGTAPGLAPLTLIDGHLRREEIGEDQVEVEVLDVNDDEARKLLLSMDPLAALAGFDQEKVEELQRLVETQDDVLAGIWSRIGTATETVDDVLSESEKRGKKSAELIEQYLVIVTCKDEVHQREVLRFIKGHGLECKAVMS